MASFQERLEEESSDWVDDGVITEDQRDMILSRYPRSESTRAIRVILALGALLVGLGAILFVAANWSRIPVYLRLVLLLFVTMVSLGGGWRLRYESTRYKSIGAALIFIGSLMVGATIFLVAQMFHMQANSGVLLLLWFIAVLPVAYLAESRPSLLLSLVLFPWWIAAYLGGDALGGVVSGFAGSVAGYLFYGVALYGIGDIHEETRYSDFSMHYRVFGLFFLFTVFFVLIVTDLRILSESYESVSLVVFVALGLCAATASFYLSLRDGVDVDVIWYASAFALATITLVAGWFIIQFENDYLLWIYGVVFNAGFFGLVVSKIYAGYEERVMAYVNLGLLFFVLYIGYLYLSTFAEYLPRSVSFILGGLALILGGWYLENKRREIRSDIRGESDEDT